jgi:hypothetical protein
MMILRPQGILGLKEIWELSWARKRGSAKADLSR